MLMVAVRPHLKSEFCFCVAMYLQAGGAAAAKVYYFCDDRMKLLIDEGIARVGSGQLCN
jgi:hypothetical protein